jgi:hypothetical protein
MEEVLQRAGLPSAPLIRCARAPIGDGEIGALVRSLEKEPTFRGVWTIANDGLPVAILHALDKKNFLAACANMSGVLAWNWNHHFGRLVSFTLVVPKDRQPRMFVPDDSALVRAVAERGRIAFAASYATQLTPFYIADFSTPAKQPDMLAAFHAVLRFENHERFVVRDDELAFWLLMDHPTMQWHRQVPLPDAIRARWARSFESQLHVVSRALQDIREQKISDVYVSDDARVHVPSIMPFFDEVTRLLIAPTTSPQQAVEIVCSAISDPKKIGDVIHGVIKAFGRDLLVDPLKWVVREVLWAALLSPTSTLSGLRRPWLDGRNAKGDVVVRYIDLDLVALGEDAREYWANFEFNEIFDLGYVVTGRDNSIPRIPLYKQLADLRLDCTEVEANEAIRELLTEARENRQWSAPWGARVQVDVGSLKYLDIYELEGEFIALFRDTHERFLMIPVNVSQGTYCPPMILRASEDEKVVEENTQAALALVLLVASVVRDFLVVENRQAQFLARVTKGPRCSTNEALSVIYLPRVRYLRPDVDAFQKTLAGDTHRAAHDVSPHLRKADTASSGQVLLAMRYGFSVPRGYTFVRPHRRGDADQGERQRIYRSRSASAILYRVLTKAPLGSRPAWFDFEKDVAALMSGKGLTVVHQAASRRGDGGVDLYAHDEAHDRLWAIQCKCYAPARKVGPDVVRELAGSLYRYPAGARGMIVTTSSFTAAAMKEAAALNIEMVDGQAFVALLRAS